MFSNKILERFINKEIYIRYNNGYGRKEYRNGVLKEIGINYIKLEISPIVWNGRVELYILRKLIECIEVFGKNEVIVE